MEMPSPIESLRKLNPKALVSEFPRWWAWGEKLLLVVLILLFLRTGFIPAWKHLNSDFPNYYLIAQLYRKEYSLERVYDWIWLQRQKDHLGIDRSLVSFIPSTLPSALVVLPWCSLSPLQAKRWWLVVNLMFLLVIAVLLTAMTKLGPQRVVLLLFTAVVPLRDNFLFGQMHLFVLLLLTIAAWLHFRERFFFSGLVLAIAATLKIYPALFLIFLAFKRQWRAAIGLSMGLVTAATMSLYLFGKDTCVLYVKEILPRGLRGETIDPYSVTWNSLSALLRRLFIAEPELNPVPVVHLPWLYSLLHPLVHGLIFVIFMWAIGLRTDRAARMLEWAGYLFMLLLLSSQPGPYHFVALILATVLIVDYLLVRQRGFEAGLIVFTYALICGPLIQLQRIPAAGWCNLLFFPRLALMLIFGSMLLWILIALAPAPLRGLVNGRPSLVAAGLFFIALLAVGFVSNLRHFNGQFDNYKARLVTVPDSLFAADPVVTSRGVFFTAMIKEGYTIRRLNAGLVIDLQRVGGDWFGPTVGDRADAGWAEQSSSEGSRIVRFFPDLSTQNPAELTIEAENAEQPVVSPDGKFLAFIREVRGRGSLWIRPTGAAQGNTLAVEAKQIAEAKYDVREVSFAPDDRLVFSAKTERRFALYLMAQTGAIKEMADPSCSARYPAMSPDGQWLAFSCEDGGNWQIYTMNLQTKKQLQLTNSECNSVSPAWTADSSALVYATDCGRGLGLTALAKLAAFPSPSNPSQNTDVRTVKPHYLR